MTIFEAKPLKSAVGSRAKQYEDLLGQVETLKKEFQGIVDLDEELAGSGATAIKNFYRAQVIVADAWIELFTTQISFLKGIPAILEDADLSGETVVEVPFLEGEVTHGLSNAKSMVNQQSTDLQKIFQNIDDILPLKVFDQEDFHEKMEKAEKEKNDTIKKVQEVDNKLVEEYQVSEAQESVAVGLLQALLEATSQDGTVSPMNFNQSAFQASQAYQVKGEVAENMQGYRDFKQQEEEARKLEQEMEELENRPWYEKAWDTTKTFTGEITGYYDSVRATTGVDPVTGRKLSEAERIAAGAMAAAGFIPIVGWAGRAVKGGSAIYKTAKTMNAAEHAMSAYKTADSMKWMAQAEKGIYGLTSANEANAYLTGKDLLGNEYSGGEQGFTLAGIIGMGSVMKNGMKLNGPNSRILNNDTNTGPVEVKAPPGASAEQIAQVKAYVEGSNKALQDGALSPTGRISTKGKLRQDASRSARLEGKRAAESGTPYKGHVGHVPDTTWGGKPDPHSWLDLDPKVNTSLGGQAKKYPIGYRPTEFKFVKEDLDE
ncbi:ribonuclease YeeF family protein [Peribacillus sp. NPDC097206]|uniref:ribonuclease YeeF family protein n=1 Tax=unclassified Peribacillus TaxID=2675266 RepID=UPI0037F401AB